jgi:cytochrome c peroxidase
VPDFAVGDDGDYTGGLFHDGRASNLVAQASQPITSAKEMALTSAAVVRERIRENPAYVDAFNALLGDQALATPDRALASVAEAIAAFESSPEFSTFDSRYDRYLRGEATLTREEDLGRILFFSPLSNCSQCHLVDERENRAREVFTNFEYHNIGVPANERLREVNGSATDHVDPGLEGNPLVSGEEHRGKVRVPSLRNVAVTAPYMRNGAFAELGTAILFYNRFLVDSPASRINPETGEPWGEAEVPATVAHDRLATGQPLSKERVRQIEAFLKTLTDRRYEHLLGRSVLE